MSTRVRSGSGLLAVLALLIASVAFFAVVGTARAETAFLVNSTGDGGDADTSDNTCETATEGECTLRAAIQQANANGNAAETDTIEFDIPAAQCVTATDVCTISPATEQLPNINQSVTVDGYTQTGASPNTIENGPTPDAANTGSDAQIKIELNGTSVTRGDGLRVVGTGDVPVNDVTIKGLAINRFQDDGIQAEDATRVTIEGNHIGTDAAGAQALGNGFGVFVSSISDVTLGGATPAARNVIAASRTDNVLTSSTSNMTIQNNYVGTDAQGTQDFGGGDDGMDINGAGSGSLIGGTSPAARNVSFGSNDAGMELFNNITSIRVVGNSVSGNGNQGVDLTTSSVDGVSILTNSISDNGTGIRLAAGANNNQTRPVLTSATNTGGDADAAVVTGTLDSTPNSTFTVQFFSNETADPSGFGEGEVYEGQTTNVTTNADGDATFSAPTDSPVEAGRVITATATNNTTGDTSEFSNGVQSTGDIADLSIEKEAPQAVDVGTEFDYTLDVANSGPDTATNVTVTDELPSQIEFVSASEGCNEQNGTVTCDVGDLGTTPADNSEEITISVRAVSPGNAENSATVDSDTADPDDENDTDMATTSISAPGISVSDESVSENGRNVTFTVTLSRESVNRVQVDYTTSNGTARAGSDYGSRSGTLTFAPGETTRNLTIPVTDDNLDENNETFFVELSDPQNAAIADGRGKGTIRDDDACTITGTNRSNILRGTPGRDVICGLGGDDVIRGLGGSDIIRGGEGGDSLEGGDGNDAVYGGPGDDALSGGAGNDELYGEGGDDRLVGGPGRDELDGGPGDNRLTQ